ncbi:MAG: cysteine desulfurase NifS [Candidatus Omnitrophota bacterium]
MKRIYLDYAATTPTDPKVSQAMEPYLFERFGNPSSLHSYGQEAKEAVEEARNTLAQFLGAKSDEIIFTSGGTESDNFALFGLTSALKKKGNHIIISNIEHHAVLEPAKVLEKEGFSITYIPVDKFGIVDPALVKKAINPKTILISIMHANNEIGSIQPISEIGKIAKEKGVVFHSDAVQTVGHIPVNVDELNVDLLSLSAHKFYGPKGIGALYVRQGTRINRYLHGGDQEKGRRASTHNTPGIVGLGQAIKICQTELKKEEKIQIALRDKIIKGIIEKIPDCILNGHPTQRLPNNINFSFKYIEGESIILNLDMAGIAASTGSACTSSSLEPSHVLLAIGLTHEVAHGSLRITLGRWTKDEDINYLLEQLPPIIEKLRKMSPLYPG